MVWSHQNTVMPALCGHPVLKSNNTFPDPRTGAGMIFAYRVVVLKNELLDMSETNYWKIFLYQQLVKKLFFRENELMDFNQCKKPLYLWSREVKKWG